MVAEEKISRAEAAPTSAKRLLRHVSMRQIEVFEAVARHMSITRAAEELHLAQPTVSAQIKALAETAGHPLYEQVGRRIFLTDAGKAMVQGFRQIIDALANTEMTLGELKGLRQGRLRLSVISTAKYFAPMALGEFARQYPDIELELIISNRETLLRRIEENLSDLYIMGQPPRTARLDLEVVPFAPNPLVVIARRDHPLARARRIPAARIAEEPFILREIGSGTRQRVEQHFAALGLPLTIRLSLTDSEAIKHAVAGHLGLAVVSAHAMNLETGDGPLVALDVEGFPLQSQWNIVYPRSKALSVLARQFLSFLKIHGGDYLSIR